MYPPIEASLKDTIESRLRFHPPPPRSQRMTAPKITFTASRGKFSSWTLPKGTMGVSIEVMVPDSLVHHSDLFAHVMEEVRQEVFKNYRPNGAFIGSRLSGEVDVG